MMNMKIKVLQDNNIWKINENIYIYIFFQILNILLFFKFNFYYYKLLLYYSKFFHGYESLFVLSYFLLLSLMVTFFI